MRTIEELIDAVREEAERSDFPVDREVYDRAKKNVHDPVLFAGALDSKVCLFGRDLGKNEVIQRQPLIGAGGRLIRSGVFEKLHGTSPPSTDKYIESILPHVLLTNTVPYKPPGNKAYSETVKERFRPFVAELLTCHWSGTQLISLGNEAFQWFSPYVDGATLRAFWKDEERYQKELPCELKVEVAGKPHRKRIILAPLPHPSPLNRRWLPLIPELLQNRLSALS